MIGSPRDIARRAAVAGVRRAAEKLNFDLVWRDYYSPIPDADGLTDEVFDARTALAGIDWGPDRQLAHYRRLLPFIEEMRTSEAAQLAANDSFGGLDAEVLYATVRVMQPAGVFEIGAGHSTLVTAAAVLANADQGVQTRFTAADPYPSPLLDSPPEGLVELRAIGAADVPVEELTALSAGDILFVDTTHVVKLGGEVNHLFLEVFPRLAPGVIVHVHDVFLPWEYPREWVQARGYYWNEQYLLQAFLVGNDNVEILLGNHWLQREGAALLPDRSVTPAPPAGSLWFRVRTP